MNSHLSEDQFASYLAGQATQAEIQHAQQCPECGAELNRFGAEILLFQSAVSERVDDRIANRPLLVVSKPSGAVMRIERWAFVAAISAVLILLPFVGTERKPEEAPQLLSADEVMNRVNLHLAQSVPSPMQPLLLGLPKYESNIESGGDR